MNTINNPTREQIIEFCTMMETQLLAALDRGSHISIGVNQQTKDIDNDPEYGKGVVVDCIHIGAKFEAKFRERGF